MATTVAIHQVPPQIPINSSRPAMVRPIIRTIKPVTTVDIITTVDMVDTIASIITTVIITITIIITIIIEILATVVNQCRVGEVAIESVTTTTITMEVAAITTTTTTVAITITGNSKCNNNSTEHQGETAVILTTVIAITAIISSQEPQREAVAQLAKQAKEEIIVLNSAITRLERITVGVEASTNEPLI